MDITFAVMPFADLGRPAIGVSLLKAAAIKAGYSACVEYCNVDLGDELGAEVYQQISSGFAPDLVVGEWYFAHDLFAGDIPEPEQFVHQILSRYASEELSAGIVEGRAASSRYLDKCARRIAARGSKIVGFTTTFHQTCASLAVAKRLKGMPDPPVIIFGGANCEGEMGLQLLQSFPWIDYICCGEADVSFPKLLANLLNGTTDSVPGVLQQGVSGGVARSEAIQDLDSLPYPDYDDYFEQLEQSAGGRDTAYNVIVETSRGCWWGAKHHCTFCGLNGDTMVFRSKSPRRAFEEMTELSRKYGISRVGCVDNILDMRYIDTLFPLLAESGMQLELFYEVKANLRLDQLRKMYSGGIRQIQPGIESFSNQILQLMDKGVSGLQNIQLMRWCEEVGIDCAWNILGGFPEESPAEYDSMASTVPLLTHLAPPVSCGRIRLDRFSPFHSQAQRFGFRKLRPSRAYFYVFPLGRREMNRLAYFFDFDYGDDRDPEVYMQPLRAAVSRWVAARRAGNPPKLDAWFDDSGSVRVFDSRDVANPRDRELHGLEAKLLLHCDTASTAAALVRRLSVSESLQTVETTLARLASEGLLLQEAGYYLSLPVFRGRPSVTTQPPDAYIVKSPAPDPIFRMV